MKNVSTYNPLNDILRGFFVRPMDLDPHSQVQNVMSTSFKVDIRENTNSFLVHAELPGVSKEAINVDIDGNTVSISAETTQEKEVQEGEQVLRSERYFGKTARSFTFPVEVDETGATANFKDGILELSLPKKVKPSGKRLSIS